MVTLDIYRRVLSESLRMWGLSLTPKREMHFFLFPFFFFPLAPSSIREEKPKEGGKAGSVTVQLRSLTR